MCVWCGSHWECDGEGGSCAWPMRSVRKVTGKGRCQPHPIGWKVDKVVNLPDKRGRAWVRVDAVAATTEGGTPRVELRRGTQRWVITKKQNGGHAPNRPTRKWQLNEVVELALPEGTFKVRVQCYEYKKDDSHNKEHCEGRGPKVRVVPLKGGGTKKAKPKKKAAKKAKPKKATKKAANTKKAKPKKKAAKKAKPKKKAAKKAKPKK